MGVEGGQRMKTQTQSNVKYFSGLPSLPTAVGKHKPYKKMSPAEPLISGGVNVQGEPLH